MDLTSLKRNKTVCHCEYCGYECMPWEQGIQYILLKDEKLRKERYRTSYVQCTNCKTLESFEYIEYEKIEDHPLLIENYEKTKNL